MEPNSTDLDWIKYNLTPEYVKTTLEDLANDQLDLEDKLTEQNKRLMLAMGGALVSVGLGVLMMKQLKAMLGGIQMLASNVHEINQFLGTGMVVPAPVGTAKEAPRKVADVPPVRATEGTTARDVDASVPSESPAIEMPPVDVGGAGYDPGPQPGPDDALPPVFDDVDDPEIH